MILELTKEEVQMLDRALWQYGHAMMAAGDRAAQVGGMARGDDPAPYFQQNKLAAKFRIEKLKTVTAPVEGLEPLLTAIRSFRNLHAGQDEHQIRDALATHLRLKGIPAMVEVPFGKRCRADIWVDGLVVELKKKRPRMADLVAQLTRYAEAPESRALVLVLERSVQLPAEINGKPLHIISLNALWGIAL